jgi:broad specificity phosphatase PhoE
MKPINLYIIRHGRSTGNDEPDKIGQAADCPLTDVGRSQAEALGDRFLADKIEFDGIFCSTFLRAVDTADIVAKKIGYQRGISYSDALVEYNPGKWMGCKRSEIMSDQSNFRKMLSQSMGFQFPGGESMYQVERRAAEFLEKRIIFNADIRKLAEERETHYAIVNHGQTCKAIFHYVMGFNPIFIWRMKVENTSVSHLRYDDSGFAIESINDTSHLKALKLEKDNYAHQV